MEGPLFQWPRGLRRGSAATHLLGLWVRTSSEKWMSLSCECLCCQVQVSASGRSLVQRSSSECGGSNECDREVPPPLRKGKSWLGIGSKRRKKKKKERKKEDYVRPNRTFLLYECKNSRITHEVECDALDFNEIWQRF